MTEENKQTKEYIDPHEYIKEEDPEQQIVTDTIEKERKIPIKLIVILLSIAVLLTILFINLTEYMGGWLIYGMKTSKSEFVNNVSEWGMDNLPLWLLWKGVAKDVQFTINYPRFREEKHAEYYKSLLSDDTHRDIFSLTFRLCDNFEDKVDISRIAFNNSDYLVRWGTLIKWQQKLPLYTKDEERAVLYPMFLSLTDDPESKVAYSALAALRHFYKKTFYEKGLYLLIDDPGQFARSYPSCIVYGKHSLNLYAVRDAAEDTFSKCLEKLESETVEARESILYIRLRQIHKRAIKKENIEPDSVAKAVDILAKDENAIKQVKEITPDEEWKLFMGLGEKIQIDFQLWGDNHLLLNECKRILGIPEDKKIHPDSASQVIIDELIKKVKGTE